MKKIFNITLGFVVYSICAVIFMGYGHVETHTHLNTSMGLRFLELINTNAIADKAKFKNYEFKWNNNQEDQPQLIGPALTKDYYVTYSEKDEVDKSYDPLTWIKEGGWMEDEPWGPASICHFYDPVGIDAGKTWLTDNSGKLEWMVDIPKSWFTRDALSWVTAGDNKYGWPKAKEYVVKALKESNIELRKNYMAKAYRCLGQSLHLVADMGCTPHVRNDSHPPKFSVVIGDPDPYEDICKKLETYTLCKATEPNAYLKAEWEKPSSKFEDIFKSLAIFTNGRFFSGGTIYTDKYAPKIRPTNPYTSPMMTEAEYNPSEHAYYKTYDQGKVKVMMCKDEVPVSKNNTTRGIPYLDYECVESMAAAIMPNVVEAGANVIRLFVPSLKMEITEAKLDSGGIIRGSVSYYLPSTDDEYFGLFDVLNSNIYNGPVNLFINGTDTKIVAEAKKNKFEFKLDGKIPNFKKDDIAVAKLEFGGIVLKSEEKKVGDNQPNILDGLRKCTFGLITLWGDGVHMSILISPYYETKKSPINWAGDTFQFSETWPDPVNYYGPGTITLNSSGTISPDGKTVLSFSAEIIEKHKTVNFSHERYEMLEGNTIPLEKFNHYTDVNGYQIYYKLIGSSVQSRMTKIVSYEWEKDLESGELRTITPSYTGTNWGSTLKVPYIEIYFTDHP